MPSGESSARKPSRCQCSRPEYARAHHGPALNQLGTPAACGKEMEFLLCSDGLSDSPARKTSGEPVGKNPDPTRCANQLVQLALAAGSNDNITVQFLRIGASAPAVTSRVAGRQRQWRRRRADAANWRRSTASTGRIVSIIALVVVVAGMVWWIRRPKPGPVDNSLSQLEVRVKTFQGGRQRVERRCEQIQDAAHGELRIWPN